MRSSGVHSRICGTCKEVLGCVLLFRADSHWNDVDFTMNAPKDEVMYDKQNLLELTCGNEEAADWIIMGREYIHLYDDIVDENMIPGGDLEQGKIRVLRMAGLALELYTHKWFQRNALLLSPVMLMANFHYADSVEWEKSDVAWKRQASDWYRHGWLDAVLLTAYLCGGYDHASKMSKAFKQIAWSQHHDENGNPV